MEQEPNKNINPDTSSIVMYTAEDNNIQLSVKLDGETVWLNQLQMSQLFETTTQNITMHIRNIYRVNELKKTATCKEYLQVQQEGKRKVSRNTKFYNLDMIISVGYRVNTKRGILFRQWATSVLKDYLIKGYAINQNITQQRYDELKDVVRLMGINESLTIH